MLICCSSLFTLQIILVRFLAVITAIKQAINSKKSYKGQSVKTILKIKCAALYSDEERRCSLYTQTCSMDCQDVVHYLASIVPIGAVELVEF